MIEIGLPSRVALGEVVAFEHPRDGVEAVRRRTSSMLIGSSHSALYRTSVRSAIEDPPELIEQALGVPATSSWVSRGRVSVLPEGSPTCAVKSPTISTAVCPASWNCRSLRSTTAHPSVTTGGGRVQPELDPQRPSEGQLALELLRGDDLGGTGEQARKVFRSHGAKASSAERRPPVARWSNHGRSLADPRGRLVRVRPRSISVRSPLPARGARDRAGPSRDLVHLLRGRDADHLAPRG